MTAVIETAVVPDAFAAAHAAAEAHIVDVWTFHHEAEDAETAEDLEQLGEGPVTLAPFCGCTTCEVREILHAAVPVLGRALAAGTLTVEDLVGVAGPA